MVRAMKKKTKVIDLLVKISKGEKTPEYVRYRNYLTGSFDTMMVCKENLIYKLDQTEIYLNDELEILDEEDKDIPLIPDDELCKFKGLEKLKSTTYEMLNFNFKVLQEKINQVAEELNRRNNEEESSNKD